MSEDLKLTTLPEFAQQLGVTYVVAKNMLDKPDAPAPAVSIGNRRAWTDADLKKFITDRYSFVLDYLDMERRVLSAYTKGHKDGREAALNPATLGQ